MCLLTWLTDPLTNFSRVWFLTLGDPSHAPGVMGYARLNERVLSIAWVQYPRGAMLLVSLPSSMLLGLSLDVSSATGGKYPNQAVCLSVCQRPWVGIAIKGVRIGSILFIHFFNVDILKCIYDVLGWFSNISVFIVIYHYHIHYHIYSLTIICIMYLFTY